MLNSNTGDNGATKSTLNMLTKKVDALMQTVSGYSTLVSSQKGKFDDLEANKAEVPDADITRLNAGTVESTFVKTDSLQAGVTSLGDTTVKSLNILSEEGLTATIDKATINDATVDTLEVKSTLKLDNPVLDYLDLETKVQAPEGDFDSVKVKSVDKFLTALNSEISKSLKVGSGFDEVEIATTARPKWADQDIATIADVSGLTFIGTFDSVEDLPEGTKGNIAYVKGGTIAVFDTDWTTEVLPILASYRTSADQDKIDYNLQTQITTVTNDLETAKTELQENIDTLETKVDDNKEATDTEISAIKTTQTTDEEKITEIDGRVTAVEDDYVKNAPEDDVVYGMKNGDWVSVNDSSAFVPKEIKDSEGTVVNNISTTAEDGIDLSSTVKVTVSTPEEQTETTKEIVNVDYIRKNLNIKKSKGNKKRYDGGLTYVAANRKGKLYPTVNPSGSGDGAALVTLLNRGAGTGSWGVGHPANYDCNVDNYTIKTADYYITIWGIARSATVDTSTNNRCHIIAWDKHGDAYIPEDKHGREICYAANPAGNPAGLIFTYNPEIYDDYPELKNIWYFMRPNSGYDVISVFDGLREIDCIETPEPNMPNWLTAYFYSQGDNPASWQSSVHAKGLRSKPEILLVKNNNTQAMIIGMDGEGNYGTSNYCKLTLPQKVSANQFAAGKNNWWIHSGDYTGQANIIRVKANGAASTHVMQSNGTTPSQGGKDVTVGTFGASNNYLQMQNGDVMFVFNSTFGTSTTFTTGFAWCDDSADSTVDYPVTYINTDQQFYDTAAWRCSGADFPMVEAGNYVFFFYTYSRIVYPNAATTHTCSVITYGMTNTATANQYLVINKNTKAVGINTFPWATSTTAAVHRTNRWYRTRSGYTWVFPYVNIDNAFALVISPEGGVTHLDLGVGTGYRFGVAFRNSFSATSSGTAYTVGRTDFGGVNSDGIGMLISCSATAGRGGTALLVFDTPEDGGWHVFERTTPPTTSYSTVYSTTNPLDVFFPSTASDVTLAFSASGNVQIPSNSTFGIVGRGLAAYNNNSIPSVVIPDEDNPMSVEPKTIFLNKGNSLSVGISDPVSPTCNTPAYNDYDAKAPGIDNVIRTVQVSGDAGYNTTPTVWFATESDFDDDTLYLNDGDYEISSVDL